MTKGIRQQARRRSSGRAFGNSTKPKLVVCALCAMLFGLCLPAQAQGPGKIPKIGFLGAGVVSRPWHESFQREFQKLGYVDGKNVIFIHRFAETNYERLPALADELVRLKVDVIITPGSNDTRAAKNATKSISIVFLGAGSDPVSLGWLIVWHGLEETSRESARSDPRWSASNWSCLRKRFPGSLALGWSGTRRMRDRRRYGKKANFQQRSSVCNFIPWQ